MFLLTVSVLYRPPFIDLECDEFIPQGISCLPVRSCFVKSVKRVAMTGENTRNRNRLAAEEIQLENTEDEMDLVRRLCHCPHTLDPDKNGGIVK